MQKKTHIRSNILDFTMNYVRRHMTTLTVTAFMLSFIVVVIFINDIFGQIATSSNLTENRGKLSTNAPRVEVELTSHSSVDHEQ